MLYTDTEVWPGAEGCLYPHARGPKVLAWCGHESTIDPLVRVEALADSLEQFLRQEDRICTTCVNEMARSMNVSATTRVRWVEDYAGGTLADHLHEDAEDEGYDRLTVLR